MYFYQKQNLLMKKNILSLILLVLVFSSAFAAKHTHTDENEVRYVKKNIELNS